MSKWFQELVAETNEKCRQEGREEGRQEGKEEGTKNILDRLVEQGLLTAEEAKRQMKMVLEVR